MCSETWALNPRHVPCNVRQTSELWAQQGLQIKGLSSKVKGPSIGTKDACRRPGDESWRRGAHWVPRGLDSAAEGWSPHYLSGWQRPKSQKPLKSRSYPSGVAKCVHQMSAWNQPTALLPQSTVCRDQHVSDQGSLLSAQLPAEWCPLHNISTNRPLTISQMTSFCSGARDIRHGYITEHTSTIRWNNG